MAHKRRRQYVYELSWAEIREQLVTQWEPARVPAVEDAHQRNLTRLWNEVAQVVGVGAWTAVAQLAGQTVESLLKLRLLEAGLKPSDMTGPDGTIGRLLDRAQAIGIFCEPNEGLTIGGSVYSAQRARNMVSHASPWKGQPTEERASLSLAYVVAFAGYLFPTTEPVPSSTMDQGPVSGDPDDELGDLRQELISAVRCGDRVAAALGAEFVQRCSTYALLKLLQQVKREELASAELAGAVRGNFGYVVHAAGRARVKQLSSLVPALASFGLRGAATRSISSLLPCDPDTLRYLMERSPNRFARYVYMCRTGDPQMFRIVTGGKSLAPVVIYLVESIRTRTGSIANTCNIVDQFGTNCRDQVLAEASTDLAIWASESQPAQSVAVLRTVKDLSPTKYEIQAIVEAIAARCMACPWESLDPVPNRLSQLGILEYELTLPVVDAIVERARQGGEFDHVQRVLSDLMFFSERHRAAAREVALDLLNTRAPELDTWTYLSMCGSLHAIGTIVDVASEPEAIVAALSGPAPSESDRFRVARAVLSASQVVSADVLVAALGPEEVRRLRNTRVERPGPSQELFAQVRALL